MSQPDFVLANGNPSWFTSRSVMSQEDSAGVAFAPFAMADDIHAMADDIRAIRCTLENLERVLTGLGEQASAAVDAMGSGGGVFGILRSLMG